MKQKLILGCLIVVILGLVGFSVWQYIDNRKLQNRLNKIEAEQFKELDDQEKFWRGQIVSYNDSIKAKDGQLDISRGNIARLKRKLKDIENAPIPNIAAMDSTQLLIELKRIRSTYRLD